MGTNKAKLEYKNQTLLDFMRQRLANILGTGLENVFVSGSWPGYSSIEDEVSFLGPLGGIRSCLKKFNGNKILFVPVDMPLISEESYQLMLNGVDDAGGCYFEGHELPFLCTANEHSIRIVEELCGSENSRDRSVKAFLKKISASILLRPADSEIQFKNANTPNDWELINELTNSKK